MGIKDVRIYKVKDREVIGVEFTEPAKRMLLLELSPEDTLVDVDGLVGALEEAGGQCHVDMEGARVFCTVKESLELKGIEKEVLKE